MTRTSALSVEIAKDYCSSQTRTLRHAGLELTNHEEKAKARRKTRKHKVEQNKNTAHHLRLLPLRLPHPLRHHRHLLPNPTDQNLFATNVRSRTVVSVESTIPLRVSTSNPAQPHRHPQTDATEAGHLTIEIGRTDDRERQDAAGRGKVDIARTFGGEEVKLIPHLFLHATEHTTTQTSSTKLTSKATAVGLDRTSLDSLEGIA